jgi:hypothetical protein
MAKTKQEKAPRTPRVTELPTAQEVQERQPENVPADNRYHKHFVVSASSSDWEAPEHDSMHNANRLAILEEAMHHGLHPQGEARYDGAEEIPGNRGRDTAKLFYSVEVVPADQASAPHTVTVSKVLKEHGGKSQAE